MKKFRIIVQAFIIVFCITSTYTTSFAEPQNLSLLKNEIQNYHDSGRYQNELSTIIEKANDYITRRAQTNKNSEHPKKLAIVLDIDETSVSNYQKLVARNFVGTKQEIHKEILAADAPVIKPMLSLYKNAQKQNIRIFFITGRQESERQATSKNLKQAGFHNWAALYLRPNIYNKPSIIPFKSQARHSIARQGYTIIASIGDQYSDLIGGYAEKTFKLPNPYYFLP